MIKKELTRRDLSEFYVLSALSTLVERLDYKRYSQYSSYQNKLVNDIASFYLTHIQRACVQEASISGMRSWPQDKNHIKELEALGLTKDTRLGSNFLYARKDKTSSSNLLESARRLEVVFRCYSWSNGYGGRNWADIVIGFSRLVKEYKAYKESNIIGFDKNRDYDLYTYSAIQSIRNSLNGDNLNRLNRLIQCIDYCHMLQHNSGSIFSYFPGEMSGWIDKLLNEKAITNSLQLLREHCGAEIKNLVHMANAKDESSTSIEHQLGQVIIGRQKYKTARYTEIQHENFINQLYNRLVNKEIDKETYEKTKKVYEEKLDKDNKDISITAYGNLLSVYKRSLREQRGLFREIIDRAHTNKRLYDRKYGLLNHIRYRLYTDYETFKLVRDNPEWHEQFIVQITPYYHNIHFKWRKEVTDFLYNKFGTLYPNDYLTSSTLYNLYICLEDDGYDMSHFSKPVNSKINNNCECYECKLSRSHIVSIKNRNDTAEAFAKHNIGRIIIGKSGWLKSLNRGASSYIDENEPIGTIIGWSKVGKICFEPNEYFKSQGYLGYTGDTKHIYGDEQNINKAFYAVDISNIALYEPDKPKHISKPHDVRSFAKMYAGYKIRYKKGFIGHNWNTDEWVGIVVGYSINDDTMVNNVYYLPRKRFVDAGYNGFPLINGTINDEAVNFTYEHNMNNEKYAIASLNEITIDDEADYESIEIYEASPRPSIPKGGGNAKDFAIKYAGKKIKANEHYAYKLNAAHSWPNRNVAIGTIVGYLENKDGTKKLCYTPSIEFIKSGWRGIPNVGGFVLLMPEYKDTTYYSVNWFNVELMDECEYENQNEHYDLFGKTANQAYAIRNAGKEIYGVGPAWRSLVGYKDGKPVDWNIDWPIGTIVGYKGSLIYFSPSKKLEELGFYGNDNVITRVDKRDNIGAKCYSIINISTITFKDEKKSASTIKDFALKYGNTQIKWTGSPWYNDKNHKWNNDWPLGLLIGMSNNELHYVPSKELKEFGCPGANTDYVNIAYTSKDHKNLPYYSLFDLDNIKAIDGERKREGGGVLAKIGKAITEAFSLPPLTIPPATKQISYKTKEEDDHKKIIDELYKKVTNEQVEIPHCDDELDA